MLSAFRVCSKLKPTVFRTLSTNVKCYQSANVVKACQSKVLSPIIPTKINCRLIHISSPKRLPNLLEEYFPAIAVISGYYFRGWLQRQPIEKRRRHIIWAVFGFGVCFAFLTMYWNANVEEVPITRRRRFMCFDSEKISEKAAKAMVHQRVVLEPSHPAFQRVLRTAKRVIAVNGDIKQMTGMWTMSVVDVPGKIDAMVSAKKQVIISKDMVDACDTDDELGILLAHEMSHAILDLKSEKISHAFLVALFTTPISFLICAFHPLPLVFGLHILMFAAIGYTVTRVRLKMLEEEADAVGLQLAARACIDVRQAVSFWKLMDRKRNGTPKSSEYLSNHLTYESRLRKMETTVEETLVLRDQCQCPALGPLPRDFRRRFVKQEGEKAARVRIML